MQLMFALIFFSTYLQPDEGAGDRGGSGPHKGGGPRQSTDGQETEVSNAVNLYTSSSSLLTSCTMNVQYNIQWYNPWRTKAFF